MISLNIELAVIAMFLLSLFFLSLVESAITPVRSCCAQ
jgi:hypothetical protein